MNSHQVSRARQYLGDVYADTLIFTYRAITFYGGTFQSLRLMSIDTYAYSGSA